MTSHLILEIPVTVFFPENYSLEKDEKVGRRGSFVSYDFIQTGEFPPSNNPYYPSPPPYFHGIQFFTENSIAEFVEYCDTYDGDGTCFEGDYPDLERYYGQKEAFQSHNDYENYKLEKIGDQYYFTSYFECRGALCAIREYTTFIGDIKVDIWILLDPLQDDMQLQIELSDILFRSFYMNVD